MASNKSLHDRIVDRLVNSTKLDRDRVLSEYGERIRHEADIRGRVQKKYADAVGCAATAANLELATYNWLLLSCARDGIPRYWEDNKLRYRYTTKALSIVANLKRDDNALLARLLDPGDEVVTVKKLVNMTPQQMRPEFWEQLYEKMVKRQMRRESPLNIEDVHDGVFTCSKCGGKKTDYRCFQVRSADEPMTIFVSCHNCGNNWKVDG